MIRPRQPWLARSSTAHTSDLRHQLFGPPEQEVIDQPVTTDA